MHNHNTYDNFAHIYFSSEQFTKREAWSWLNEQASLSSRAGKVCASIRSLAYLWGWHKSKVERFIKVLKSETLIETEIRSGKTVITLAKQVVSKDAVSASETMSNPNQDNNTKVQQDSSCDIDDAVKTQVDQWVCQQGELLIETVSRHDQNSAAFSDPEFQKKEKNQKKESFEVYSIKEKTSPYGRVKKENCESLQGGVEQVSADAVSEFASSLAIEPMQLEWELGKFKDYWLSSRKKLPKDGIAAFRNWLRKSIEFKEGRKNYARFDKTRPAKTRFEQFLSAGARAVAEYERGRLDRKTDWTESALFSVNSCY